MQKELYKLCFILILPINITMAQNKAFDVQHLIRCYNSICENSTDAINWGLNLHTIK